jgi:hypothetical protein
MILLHLASRLNRVNGIPGSEIRFSETGPAGFVPSPPKVGANRRSRDNFPAKYATALALLQHSSRDRR